MDINDEELFKDFDESTEGKLEYPIESLEILNEDLEELRESISKEKLDKLNEKELAEVEEKFKIKIDQYDSIKTGNDLTEEELKNMREKDSKRFEYLEKTLEIQRVINRIAHKINNRRAIIKEQDLEDKINKYHKIIKDVEQFTTHEYPVLTEKMLTIGSLIFTAFSLIQINGISFGRSNDYTIIDRLILFCGINLFVILGIYTIFTMIKSIIRKDGNADAEGTDYKNEEGKAEEEKVKSNKKDYNLGIIGPMIVLIIVLAILCFKRNCFNKINSFETRLDNLTSQVESIKKENKEEITKSSDNLKNYINKNFKQDNKSIIVL